MHSCLDWHPTCKNMWVPTCRETWRRRWQWPSVWRCIKELGTGPKPGVRRRGRENSRKETKRGQHLQCKRKKQKKLSMSSKTSQRRARARGAHSSSSSRKRSSSEGNASTVEAITSFGTARSGRKCDRISRSSGN